MNYERDERNPVAVQGIAFAVMAYTAVMAITTITLGIQIYQARTAETPEPDRMLWIVTVWAGVNALMAGLMVARYLLSERPAEGSLEQTAPAKLMVLAVGGILGFTTVLLGLVLAHEWWDVLTGGRTAWKEWKPWLPIGLAVGGLGVMFFSLLAVRSEERTNVGVRRLIYGYNAVLTGLLVLATLGVGNVMAFFYGTHPFDWTATNIYSVTPQTKQILASLDQPVKIHVLVSPIDPLYPDVENLLTTCKSYSNKLEVEYVNSRHQIADLMSKYELADGTAMVVATEVEGKEQHHPIRGEDLEDLSARMSSAGQSRSFKGEQAIMSAITYLQGGKANQTIYFTQDSGEMKLSEAAPRRARTFTPNDRGLGSLRTRLEKSNYSVKEWQLGALDEKTKAPAPIPDDAFAVVLADPADLGEPQMAEAKLKVLEEYMKRPKGRLIVLLEPHRGRQGEVQPSGLEPFMQKFGVQVGKDIVISILRDPTTVVAALSAQGDAAFRDAFRAGTDIPLTEARSIRPGSQDGGFTANTLLETSRIIRGGMGQWTEERLPGDPVEYLTQLQERAPEEFRKKLQAEPTPIAVTVREKSTNPPDPSDPHAFMRRDAQGAPRMVVFGTASFASNSLIEGSREIYYSLFSSALGWLRDRPDLISDIQPKERKAYRLNIKAEDSTKIRYYPALLLLAGLTICGVGVWLNRRR